MYEQMTRGKTEYEYCFTCLASSLDGYVETAKDDDNDEIDRNASSISRTRVTHPTPHRRGQQAFDCPVCLPLLEGG